MSVIIATLYEPVTLELLVQQAKWYDHEVIVMKDMPTNDAWRRGISIATHSRCMILNDDIEVNAAFWDEMSAPFDHGYTHVLPAYVERYGPSPDVPIRGARSSYSQSPEGYIIGEPVHKGHAFAFDRTITADIPTCFRVYYGDDWIYWQHYTNGKSCLNPRAQFKTGATIGMGPAFSGYTTFQSDFQSKFAKICGMPFESQKAREHEISSRYFRFHPILSDTPISDQDVASNFRGVVAGIREDLAQE